MKKNDRTDLLFDKCEGSKLNKVRIRDNGGGLKKYIIQTSLPFPLKILEMTHKNSSVNTFWRIITL